LKRLIGVLWLVATLAIALSSEAHAGKYCKYKYSDLYVTHNAIICTPTELNIAQIKYLAAVMDKVYRLYPDFAKHYGVNNAKRPDKSVGIVFMPIGDLNDPKTFSYKIKKRANLVKARYFIKDQMLYLAPNVFDDDLDLAHEMVHYLNEFNGVVEESKDETMAYAFETYYRTQE
jgi:hypothetical protein